MIETFIWLLAYQFIGEVVARSLGWPVPGAVLGMLLLFLTLCVHRGVPHALRDNIPRLMTHMSLLFIPAGVGILAFWPMLSAHPLSLPILLVVATLSTFILTALVLQLGLWWQKRRRPA